LRQGKVHVSDQFEYLWAISDTKCIAQLAGSFRHSFFINGFVHCDASFFETELPHVTFLRPETWRDT
jgi:hypothetical protein